jgi:hypothetical protein
MCQIKRINFDKFERGVILSKKGSQTPTKSLIIPYDRTDGQVAIGLYHKTNKTAQEWQSLFL